MTSNVMSGSWHRYSQLQENSVETSPMLEQTMELVREVLQPASCPRLDIFDPSEAGADLINDKIRVANEHYAKNQHYYYYHYIFIISQL